MLRLEDFPDPCPLCGEEVPPTRGPNAIYCCDHCRYVARYRRRNAVREAAAAAARTGLECPHCGTVFDAVTLKRIYCSRECLVAEWRRRHRERLAAKRRAAWTADPERYRAAQRAARARRRCRA